MAGPTVRGMAHTVRKHPMACDSPSLPTMSQAMGPKREMKQPSKRPKPSAMTMKNAMWLAAVRSIVRLPIPKNASWER